MTLLLWHLRANRRVDWAPDETQAMRLPPDAPAAPPPDAAGPSIFTAIQEQLGLKLESQKGTVETLVIERTENLRRIKAPANVAWPE